MSPLLPKSRALALAVSLSLAGLCASAALPAAAQQPGQTPGAGQAPAAAAAELAVWQPRKLHFVYMGFTTHYSCDGLRDQMRSALLQLGANPKDLKVRETGCSAPYGRPEPFPGVDATFSVLEPTAQVNPASTSAVPVAAQWQTVNLKLGTQALDEAGQCELVEQIKQKILPLFSTRNVQYGQNCIPHQLTPGGTYLKVDVLKPQKANGNGAPA